MRPSCRQVSWGPGTCAHRNIWARKVGTHGVLVTDSLANTPLSLHLPWQTDSICLKQTQVICNLLKEQTGCNSPRLVWPHGDRTVRKWLVTVIHMLGSVGTAAPVGAVWDQAE